MGNNINRLKKTTFRLVTSSIIAGSLMSVNGVNAQEKENVNEGLHTYIYNEIVNKQSIDIEVESQIELLVEALNHHLSGELNLASEKYDSLLNNEDLDEGLIVDIMWFQNVINNEIELSVEYLKTTMTEREIMLSEDKALLSLSEYISNEVGDTIGAEQSGLDTEDESETINSDSEENEESDKNKPVEYPVNNSNIEDKEKNTKVNKESDKPTEETTEQEETDVSQEKADEEDKTDDVTNQDDINTNEEISTFSVTIQSETFESADEFYANVINAPNASAAWDRAMTFKDAYPGESRLNEAINHAGERILSLGQNAHRSGNYNTALGYYTNLINEEYLNADLSNALNSLYNRATNQESISYASTYYNNTINASNATAAWNNVQLFIETYPNDNRINAALDSAGSRILSMGQSSHRSANYSRAQYYYELIIDEPLLVGTHIYAEAELFNNQASNNDSLTTSDDLFSAVMNASNATNAWNAAQDFKAQFPSDSRLSEAFNSSGNRIFSMGQSSHRSANYSRARYYYELIIDESELVGSQLHTEAEILYTQALNDDEMNLPTDMFNAVINASNATNAWNAAQDFKAQFPNDTRVSEALSSAGNRVFSMGRSSFNRGNNNTALTYFNWLKDETDLESSLRNQAIDYIDNIERIEEADEYFNNVINASNATNAWNTAQDFKAQFPRDSRLREAFNSAGNRIYSMGKNSHRSNNFSNALYYYNLLLDEESLVPATVINEVEVFSNQAEDGYSYITAGNLYSQSMNANTATIAWNLANDGLRYFPNDSRFNVAFDSAAERIFALGTSNHNRGNFSTARTYYSMLVNNSNTSSPLRNKAEAYNYLADNNLHLTNTIVRETNYSHNLSQVADIQLGLTAKPQMSASGGGWRDATRNEVLRYINPNNFLPEDTSDLTMALSTIRVITSALNVRSGPGTDHDRINQVTHGQEFTILEEKNNWYRINVDGVNGWVSGHTSYVERANGVLQFLVLSGTSGISVQDLNEELENSGILDGHGATFRQASLEANINEIYLVSHALLETGRGSSNLATGILVDEVDGEPVTPRVVYNMFGIGAYDGNADKYGSERAYQLGWFTPEEAIIGGAKWISSSYINNPTYQQDTLYKMRWNPATPGAHQYATDVAWAQKQVNTLNTIVQLSQKYDLILNFDIPSY